MMKRGCMQHVTRAASITMAIAGFAACGNNNSGQAPSAPAAPERGSLLQSPVQEVASYSTSDLLALLPGSSLGKILLSLAYSPLCTITIYHIEYETVDPAQNLTAASGALMVPSGPSGCEGGRPIVMYAHGTKTNSAFNIAQVTASGNDEGLLLAAVFAASGYIVVAPNYAGYDN